MAMWKKMAEAFGRAMSERAKDTPASKAVVESKTIKDLDKIGSMHQASPEQRAYLEGHEHSGPDNYYAAKERGGNYEERIDEIEDENSDSRLEKAFDEGFNSAIARRKQDVKDWYGKDFPQDKADEGADTFEKDLWRVIGELRDKGMSGNDILNVLKGTNH